MSFDLSIRLGDQGHVNYNTNSLFKVDFRDSFFYILKYKYFTCIFVIYHGYDICHIYEIKHVIYIFYIEIIKVYFEKVIKDHCLFHQGFN